MAAQSPVITGAATTSGLVTGVLLTALVERTAYVLKVSESLADLTQPVGMIYGVVHAQSTGYAYYYDATDTTTPDDGVTCLVDFDGHRYLVADSAALAVSSVLSQTNTPPGSPTAGDSYLVGTAPTGAWAAHANDIALYTLRGWVFAQPAIGHTIYNQATGSNFQFDENGDWVGFAAGLTDASIAPRSLELPFGLPVESTENTPPGAPVEGQYWIVGTAPTGAFTGQSNNIAGYASAAFYFITAYEGATVFNKDLGYELFYTSGTWLGGTGSDVQNFTGVGAATWTKPAKGNIAFIQVWGAGGSGGRAGSSDGGGGGGGGGYIELWLPLSALAATVAISVGTGGASRTSDNTNGAAGGNTTFGSHATAYGGGGGSGATVLGGGGGGGGGQLGAGGSSAGSNTGGTAGAPTNNVSFGGGAGGNGSDAGSPTAAGPSIYGGGGGGGGSGAGTAATDGGLSIKGGGGGGGASDSGTNGAGGASNTGGAGGAGNSAANNATAGVQPGGGGGGSETGNSGKGGDGMCRVTVI